MRSPPCPILYVDDELPNIVVFESTFGEEFDVVCASSGEQALEVLERLPVGVLLTDQRMPGMTGIDLCEKVREWHPDVVRILVTAYSDQNTAVSAINRGGVHRYLTKPWDEWDVRQILADAVTRVHLERTVKQLREQISERERAATLSYIRGRVLYDLANVTTTLLMTTSNLEHHLEEARGSLPMGLCGEMDQEMGELRRALSYLVELHDKTRSVLARPSPAQHSLAGVVADAIELVRPDLSRTARIASTIPPGLSVWVDRTDLVRILVNLFQNARRALDTGGVKAGEVQIEAWPEGERVRIVVSDNGPGLPNDLRERLFRADSVPRGQGSGLGLPISRELARANQGEIGVADDGPLPGATFWLTFPSEPQEIADD